MSGLVKKKDLPPAFYLLPPRELFSVFIAFTQVLRFLTQYLLM